MAISANTLFHFTSFDSIISILNGNYFRVCYSKETFVLRHKLHYYFPMVCFCDIPLTMTKEHINDYDGYAIGLKKEWAIGHGLNPVFYLNEFGMTHTLEGLSEGANYTGVGRNSFAHLFCHMKPYKGTNYKRNEHVEKCFYNEKEWRFVPFLPFFRDSYSQFYTIDNFPADLNAVIKNHRLYKLHFLISDIKYIIIKSNSEKENFMGALKSDYLEPINNHNIKIFSIDEIFEDF